MCTGNAFPTGTRSILFLEGTAIYKCLRSIKKNISGRSPKYCYALNLGKIVDDNVRGLAGKSPASKQRRHKSIFRNPSKDSSGLPAAKGTGLEGSSLGASQGSSLTEHLQPFN